MIGLCLLLTGQVLPAQDTTGLISGRVSYVTTSSVYVRFENTSHLNTGDTLFLEREGRLMPAMVVSNKSSLSCVCLPLPGMAFSENDRVVSKFSLPPAAAEASQAETVQDKEVVDESPVVVDEPEKEVRRQSIGGRVSVSSYTNWTSAQDEVGQRMRYTFSFGGQNLGGSKLSLEMYISFVHRLDQWEEIEQNIYNGLKVYNLSLRYDITQGTRLWLGRKINYRLTSLGAMDGLQFEQDFGSFTLGAVAGSRPDYSDFSINFDLFQYGLYLTHHYQNKAGSMENTLAYMDQNNQWQTDRRFVYFQHTNTLVKNLFLLATAEMDLYGVEDGQASTTFDLSALYLLLRYRVRSNLSLSASYTARQQIIYYETYKDFLERLLEENTLQGYRLMVHYRPLKHLAFGIKGGYRFRPDDPDPSKDLYGYLSYSMVPGIKANATASVAWLETSWQTGWVYSLGLSRDLVAGKLFGGLNYRYVSYDFNTSDTPLVQHIAEVNMNWRIYGKLTLGAYYEGAFESEDNFHRVYLNLTQRF